jgi:hypothetical protein
MTSRPATIAVSLGSNDKHIVRIVGLVAALSAFISTVQYLRLGRAATTFASYGQTKRLAIPLIALVFLCAMVVERCAAGTVAPRGRGLALALWAFTVISAVRLVLQNGGAGVVLTSLVQGVALIGLFSVAVLFALTYGPPSRSALDRVVTILIWTGLFSTALQGALYPLTSLVPAALGACLLRVLARHRALWHAVLAGYLVTYLVAAPNSRLWNGSQSSTTLRYQLVCCGLVLAGYLLRGRVRSPAWTFWLALVGVAAWAVPNTTAGSVMLGRYVGPDLSLAQRSFEASRVSEQVQADPLTWAFGGGPGATIDLADAPDADTLAVAGRNLVQVDDVHLLTSEVYLKFGMLGLVWLAVLLARVAQVVYWIVVQADRRDISDVGAAIFLLVFVIEGLTASTDVFTDPLLIILLVFLLGRQSASADRKPAVLRR